MSRVAFVFPGQGSETPEMGLALAAASRPAADALAVASSACGVDVARGLRRGSIFGRTDQLQPALTAVCVGAAETLRSRGVVPCVVLGHSLGELAAWAASGRVRTSDVIELAATRGRLMQREATLRAGGLRALRMSEQDARALLAQSRLADRVFVAAVNADDEVVLSGALDALDALDKLEGIAQTTTLAASGAWHSPLMAGACDEFRSAAMAILSKPSETGFVSASTGALVVQDQDVPALLADQLVHPVRFVAALRALRDAHVSDIVVPGPARVVRGLCRRVLGDLPVHAVESPADVEDAVLRFAS